MTKKEHHRLWKIEWRRKNPDKVLANRIKHNEYMRAYHKKRYPKVREKMREYYNQIRRERAQFVVDFFGGKCVRCGFFDIRALQMDHTHGRNGEKRLGNIDNRWKFVRDFPEEAKKKYQLLCANCNCIKRAENHEHRKSKYD